MIRRLFTIILLFIFCIQLFSQIGSGEWRDHLPYKVGEDLIEANNKIYCSTKSGVFIFNKSDNSFEKLSRINGLSDLKINSIAYSEQYNKIIIGYNNCNIDIIQNNQIINYPYIKNKIIIGNKTINNILIYNQYAYISCGFGIILFNLDKNEIKDTYQIQIGNETLNINDVGIQNNKLIAATDSGLFEGDLNENLVDFSKWYRITNFDNYNHITENIEIFNNHIYISQNIGDSNSVLLFNEGASWNSLSYTLNKTTQSIDAINNELFISTSEDIILIDEYNNVKKIIDDYGFSSNVNSKKIWVDNNNAYWIADRVYGLVSNFNGAFRSYKPNGPANNFCGKLKYNNNTIWAAAGGITERHQNLWRPAQFHYFYEEKWSTFSFYSLKDILDMAFDPDDPDHIYAGSYGYGLLEIDNKSLINEFNLKNSDLHTLHTVLPNQNYYRVGGVTLDRKKNVWMTNMKSPNLLHVYTNDKKWIEIQVNGANDVYASEIIITKNNYKWITLLRGAGIVVYDDNNTIDNLKDDRSKKFGVFDENNKVITWEIYALAEDKKGNIWVGTDEGVYVFYNANNVFDGEYFYASSILIPRNDGTNIADKLLETEVITCIEIDGANRKWFGTRNSGVYLFSDDGLNQIHHFSSENSPLLSNYIFDIEINGLTGEVFFSTSEGLISYKSTASDDNLQKNILYAYPNPVREDYNGPITIAGLIEDSNVKITDINGNIVYETKTLGGQAIWDGNTMSGERVKTGVYLIFCTDDFGTKTKITKLLVIN